MYTDVGPFVRMQRILTGSILGTVTIFLLALFLVGMFYQSDYGSRISAALLGNNSNETIVPNIPESSPNATTDIPGRVGPTGSELKVLDSLVVSEKGEVVEGVDVRGEIQVLADDVTIRNFRANNVFKNPEYKNLVLEDGEIHGEQDSTAHGVVYSDFTARRLNIHGVEDAFKAHGSVLIENCWVHDLAFVDDGVEVSHNDGVQVSSGSNVVIKNSLFENIKGTAAVFIKPDQGTISDIRVENNILGGGAYTLYVISTPEYGYPSNVSIINNTFLEENLYGYTTIEQSSTVFSGNKTQSGGSL